MNDLATVATADPVVYNRIIPHDCSEIVPYMTMYPSYTWVNVNRKGEYNILSPGCEVSPIDSIIGVTYSNLAIVPLANMVKDKELRKLILENGSIPGSEIELLDASSRSSPFGLVSVLMLERYVRIPEIRRVIGKAARHDIHFDSYRDGVQPKATYFSRWYPNILNMLVTAHRSGDISTLQKRVKSHKLSQHDKLFCSAEEFDMLFAKLVQDFTALTTLGDSARILREKLI